MKEKDASISTRVHDKPGYFTGDGFRSLQKIPQINDALCLVRCGEERCKPGHAYRLRHTEHHLHFILSGSGSFTVNGETVKLGAGEIFFIPADWDISYEADSQTPWFYTWVAFRGKLSWELLQQAGFDHGHFYRGSKRPMEEYHSIILNMLDAHEATVEHELLRLSLLYQLFSLLVQEGEASRRRAEYPTDNPYIHRAIALVDASLSTITVAELSRQLGLNRSYLSALFQQELQCSPQDFLRKHRMEKAALWLTTSNLRVQDISATLGYREQYSFSKAFRSVYHVSPMEYRNGRRRAADEE